ncbi:hypothetical protein NXV03_03250 [Phocaeicola vulgatus]|nr:hypothetical protein [Phocaeicola vulgatus]
MWLLQGQRLVLGNGRGRDREDVHVSCSVCGGGGELDAIITVDWKPSSK